jgi:hypothetical protein
LDKEGFQLPPLLQDRAYEAPAPDLPVTFESRAAFVERERLAGFPSINPIQRQVALEFVLSGATLKALAQQLDYPLAQVQRMFGDPILRAFITELQKEFAAHRLLTEQWVESQILKNMPKFEGEEPIPVVTREGEQVLRNKFHGKELVAIYKAFGGNADQKKNGGVHVTIDFGRMGVSMDATAMIDVDPLPNT